MAKAKKQETRVGYETFRENMGFSEALNFLKEGHLISRAGWNGKGMYLYQVDGDLVKLETKKAIWAVEVLPFIIMRTASGALQPGWNPSQSDVLAKDWMGLNHIPMETVFVTVVTTEEIMEEAEGDVAPMMSEKIKSSIERIQEFEEHMLIAAAISGGKFENNLRDNDFDKQLWNDILALRQKYGA